MNIETHSNIAKGMLLLADEQVESGDYIGARASLAKAYSHTRELIDKVQKLVALKAMSNRPAGG